MMDLDRLEMSRCIVLAFYKMEHVRPQCSGGIGGPTASISSRLVTATHGLALGDISGRGVEAVMMMVEIMAYLRGLTLHRIGDSSS